MYKHTIVEMWYTIQVDADLKYLYWESEYAAISRIWNTGWFKNSAPKLDSFINFLAGYVGYYKICQYFSLLGWEYYLICLMC